MLQACVLMGVQGLQNSLFNCRHMQINDLAYLQAALGGNLGIDNLLLPHSSLLSHCRLKILDLLLQPLQQQQQQTNCRLMSWTGVVPG